MDKIILLKKIFFYHNLCFYAVKVLYLESGKNVKTRSYWLCMQVKAPKMELFPTFFVVTSFPLIKWQDIKFEITCRIMQISHKIGKSYIMKNSVWDFPSLNSFSGMWFFSKLYIFCGILQKQFINQSKNK